MRFLKTLLTFHCVLYSTIYGFRSQSFEGEDNRPGFAAIVQPDGSLDSLSEITFVQANALIYTIDVNANGLSLVGGENTSGIHSIAYASFVNKNGAFTPLNSLFMPRVPGTIFSVALNNEDTGLIGGISNTHPFVAKVYSNGTVEQILGQSSTLLTPGEIRSVSLNSLGEGLVGGNYESGTRVYAALLDSNGNLTQIEHSEFDFIGVINGTALNDSEGMLVGYDQTSSCGFAAKVDFAGNLTEVIGSNTASTGTLRSCAINANGLAIIGGNNNHNGAYIAFVQQDNTVQEIHEASIPTQNGTIFAVALNDFDVALVGGTDGNDGYAAFLNPDGTITTILGSNAIIENITIENVKINNAGIGLISGRLDYNGFYHSLAVVAPNGTVTLLPETHSFLEGAAISAAVSDPTVRLNDLVPTTFSSYSNIFNLHLASTYSLETYLTKQNWLQNLRKQNRLTSLIVANAQQIAPNSPTNSAFRFWGNAFGNYVHESAAGANPFIQNAILGGIIGCDYSFDEYLFGLGFSYGYNGYLHGDSFGNGHINEEALVLYGSYQQNLLRINMSLWGGLYQLKNNRYAILKVTSIGKTTGWVLDPHLGLSFPFYFNKNTQYLYEPFFGFDWISNWQDGFIETGASGLNLVIPSSYSVLVRGEVGARFYQTFCYKYGDIVFQEKFSYINQSPFGYGPITTTFVSSVSTFPVAVGSPRVQNLGGAELNMTFTPVHGWAPYIGLDLQGAWGSYYQTYYVNMEIGKTF